jgi:hypothetical protein
VLRFLLKNNRTDERNSKAELVVETRRGLLPWDTHTYTRTPRAQDKEETREKKRIEKPSGMYVCSLSLKQKKSQKRGEKSRGSLRMRIRQTGRGRERREEATARERGGGERGMMNIMLVGCEARVTTTRPDKDANK